MILNEDCRGADPKGFQVMICDPPYSEHVHKNATSQSRGGGARHRDLGFDCLSDDLRTAIAHMASGVQRWSLIYSDVEGLSTWREAGQRANARYIRTLAWVRWSMPSLCKWPPQGFETIALFWGSQKGRKSWNGPGNLTHLNHKCLRGEGKHKAEKPLDQMLDLVTWFTNPGDRVLDPCAGSGTVGLACKLLGRDYVGYEIDPEWALRATIRIKGPLLSARDQDRYERWLVSQKLAQSEFERMEANTSKVRRKNASDQSNGIGDLTEATGGLPPDVG